VLSGNGAFLPRRAQRTDSTAGGSESAKESFVGAEAAVTFDALGTLARLPWSHHRRFGVIDLPPFPASVGIGIGIGIVPWIPQSSSDSTAVAITPPAARDQNQACHFDPDPELESLKRTSANRFRFVNFQDSGIVGSDEAARCAAAVVYFGR